MPPISMQLTAEGTWLRVRGEKETDGRMEGAWRSRGNISNHSLVEGALRVMGREKRNNEHSAQKKREGEKGLAGRFALRLLLLGIERCIGHLERIGGWKK